MMSGRFRLSLGHSAKLESRVLELPFTQRRISLFILLPDETGVDALGRLEANMTTDNVREIISTLKVIRLYY